jgi:hypothetical protein
MNDLHALAAFKALDEGRLQPVDKGVVAEADVDGGFDGASVEAAETLWACLPQVRKWTSLATHEKALVIHTLARHRHQSETGAALTSDGREALERVIDEAQFLCDRLDNLDWSISFDEFGNDYYGHVDPSHSRLKGYLAALAQPVEAGEDGLQCPKCGTTTGNDWSQCEGSCPMPQSPHFAALGTRP